MKIVIDLTQLVDNLSGLERYAMNITREMILTDTETEYVLFYKNKVCELLEDINHRKNVTIRVYKGKNKLVFNQLQLPVYLYKEKNVDKYLIYRSEFADGSDKKFVGETEIPRFEYPFDKTSKEDVYAYYSVEAVCSNGEKLVLAESEKVKVGPLEDMLMILASTFLFYLMYKLYTYRI